MKRIIQIAISTAQIDEYRDTIYALDDEGRIYSKYNDPTAPWQEIDTPFSTELNRNAIANNILEDLCENFPGIVNGEDEVNGADLVNFISSRITED